MTPRDELLTLLRNLKDGSDPEVDHSIADRALLRYINDEEITKAFNAIEKWYA